MTSDLRPQLAGRSKAPDRDLYLARLSDVDQWPDDVGDPKPHFVVFLAMDASSVESSRIAAFADRLISQGMVYLCAWGPDCKRVHDVFDEVERKRGTSTDEAFVVTDWHDDEELDDALWFALFSAFPTDDYMETCRSFVAVVVDQFEWSEQVERALADSDQFMKEILAQEPEH